MPKSRLDDVEEIRRIDKSDMLAFSVDAAKHLQEAAHIASNISLDYPKPGNIIIAGMGGSAIGGELLKDWARNKTKVPIEVSRDYSLPSYAGPRSLVVIVSYSGDTEESLSAFLDATNRKCMTFCLSSGGKLLEFAKKLRVPHLTVPSGMPPRAALPYLFVPLLILLERQGVAFKVSSEINESTVILERVAEQNAPNKPAKNNPAKTLAMGVAETVPVIYGFGILRGAAQRFKQQFNENAKTPAKWEVFPELDHNEVVGWEKAGDLAKHFSTIFLRDNDEPKEVRSRIEITKKLLQPSGSKQLEVRSQGDSDLAKMMSTILVGDFASVYLAVLHGVDPTPVHTITLLKEKLNQTDTKARILSELEKLSRANFRP